MKHPNEKIMRDLIQYTKKAGGSEKTGCFIVKDEEIIAKAISQVEEKKDPTAHAELIAIRKACKKVNSYHLKGCWIYTTQIPCPMCASAIVWTEAKGIVYGWDGRHTWKKLNIDPRDILKTAKREIKIFGPFLEEECLAIKGYHRK